MRRAPLALTFLLLAGGSHAEPRATPVQDSIQQLLTLPAPPPKREEAPPVEKAPPPREDSDAGAPTAELIAKSKKARDADRGWIEGGDAPGALAARDWQAAEPIARGFL